jgi:hypothetical protein
MKNELRPVRSAGDPCGAHRAGVGRSGVHPNTQAAITFAQTQLQCRGCSAWRAQVRQGTPYSLECVQIVIIGVLFQMLLGNNLLQIEDVVPAVNTSTCASDMAQFLRHVKVLVKQNYTE